MASSGTSLSAIGPSAEPGEDSGSEADESVPPESSVEVTSRAADAFLDEEDDLAEEDLAGEDVGDDVLDEDVADEGDVVDDDDDCDEDAADDDDDEEVVDEEVVDEESPVDEPDGSAYAMAGVVAMATPTPRVTANAPTRPMCLAYPMTVSFR